MDTDELLPRTPKPQKRPLDPMSVDELQAYILELEGEIARVRQEIEKKTSHRGAVESLFRR
ncbi:MAG: DUF1192 domain-containing protein [Alphaproteobacteria bacterium]|nr:DUF1192 domain-containing protein [Alphaproteobacteria bacterium]MBU0798260.1 DUF1192 domain-containing protein [Alphaproteobacteria bacterium]MBU0889022.1 DUF1192 domain-containing protein [Alphaproteobacteria bacterium]MBU1814042.1 DUF1192 domain-containing protein [Alphaproteobacteria bacterium]MBU2089080.1 DUF1192 domain-containing protein [Alphaproteobacteria bacterium]